MILETKVCMEKKPLEKKFDGKHIKLITVIP